jgi:hypothetical protein
MDYFPYFNAKKKKKTQNKEKEKRRRKKEDTQRGRAFGFVFSVPGKCLFSVCSFKNAQFSPCHFKLRLIR